MQATAGKETACALVFSTNLQCNSTNPNLESFFLSAGEPFVSLLYFAQSHGDVSQPYSCAGASAPPCPGDRALHWFSWRHSSHDGASSAPCVRGPVLIVAQIGRHSLFSAFSHPGIIPPGQIFTFCVSFKYTYPPDSYGTAPNTHRSIFCSLPCGVSMTLSAGHPHPFRVSCLPRSLSDRVDVTGG